MNKYKILKPLAFLRGNKVIHYLRPAELVPLEDDEAAELGDKVEKQGTPEKVVDEKAPEKATPKKAPEKPVETKASDK